MNTLVCGKGGVGSQGNHYLHYYLIFYLKHPWCRKLRNSNNATSFSSNFGKQLLFANNKNRVCWAFLCRSQDGAWIDLFENHSENSIKPDLSNETTVNPSLFSLVNTFKMQLLKSKVLLSSRFQVTKEKTSSSSTMISGMIKNSLVFAFHRLTFCNILLEFIFFKLTPAFLHNFCITEAIL